jgi:hypothetical protein
MKDKADRKLAVKLANYGGCAKSNVLRSIEARLRSLPLDPN